MRIDNYTKFLLTIITLCLLYLCAKDLIVVPQVRADSPVKVVLVDSLGNPIIGGNAGQYIPVRLGPQ
jgi:hypothetical protein